MNQPDQSQQPIVQLTMQQWHEFLASLYERDNYLNRKDSQENYSSVEQVDAFVFSGHAEALQSSEIDGDLWGTLEDIEENAANESEAWAAICRFYWERDCILISISNGKSRNSYTKELAEDLPDDLEEWLVDIDLWQRLAKDL